MLRLMLRLCITFVIAALTAAQQTLLPRPPAPDLVLFHGKVITVDRDFSTYQAVAILGDRIMAVGNDDQMHAIAGPSTCRSSRASYNARMIT